MKFSVLGSGEYMRRGLEYLAAQGRVPVDNGDILVCLAHPKILTAEEMAAYPKGCINFHCGLPNYRGRHPLQWMLIDGVKKIPCAVHYMDEGIDTGDIIVRTVLSTVRDETYASALDKVTTTVGPLVLEAIEQIEQGTVRRKPQGDGRIVAKRTDADSEFSFSQKSVDIHRMINAMSSPMPNAFCNGVKYARSYSGNEVGDIIAMTIDGREVVATADGVVLVKRA